MYKKRHECALTEQTIRKIEYVLPKLKYSVYIHQVRSWLENFEADEIDLALDYLFYLEYIPFAELQLRLNQQIALLDKEFGTSRKYVLVPFAEYPKSNDIVMYLLAKTETYRKLKAESRIYIVADVKKIEITDESVLVFVDDFIGTAKSFNKWYKKNKIDNIIGDNHKIFYRQALLAAIIMEDGANYLNYNYPDVHRFADFRAKVFCKIGSPFNLTNNRIEMRNLCMKYGKSIITGYIHPKKQISPLGFENSEALIAFDYGTPNNSLSIIWGDTDWKPIFPRTAKSRMNKASEIKSLAAFYLGVMHKLGIAFDDDIEITINNASITLSARDDHSILVYIILIDKLYSKLQICQLLGITMSELHKIVLKAKRKLLVNDDGMLSIRGIKFLREIKKQTNIFAFRGGDNLERKTKIFVPKSFRNMT